MGRHGGRNLQLQRRVVDLGHRGIRRLWRIGGGPNLQLQSTLVEAKRLWRTGGGPNLQLQNTLVDLATGGGPNLQLQAVLVELAHPDSCSTTTKHTCRFWPGWDTMSNINWQHGSNLQVEPTLVDL